MQIGAGRCKSVEKLHINIFHIFRSRQEQFLQWIRNEEARKVAVEAALNEFMARDTQYRKDLKAHIESRLYNADKKRRIIRQQTIEVIFTAVHTYSRTFNDT